MRRTIQVLTALFAAGTISSAAAKTLFD